MNNKYNTYKDSGVEWIGEVPEHWKIERFKVLFSFSRGLPITKQDLKDEGIPCISYGEIHSKYGFEVNPAKHMLKCVNKEYLFSSFDKSLLKKGDFIFADTSEDIEGSGNFSFLESEIPVFAGYHTVIARQKKHNNYRFLAYYLDSIGSRNQIRSEVTGIKVYSITQSILKNVKVLLPSSEEQQQIVTYLDRKTTIIDELIQKKEQKIALLKEKRVALINHAVTKGLNPDVPMKDSGVEWIGEVPEHWGIGMVKRFTMEHRQGFYSSKDYDDSGYKVVRITDLKDNNIVDTSESPYYIVDAEDAERFKLLSGDFLFQRTGAHKKIGVFNSNIPSIYGSFLIRFRFSKKINHQYLLFFFNSMCYQNQLNEQIHGGVNPNIHAENIKYCYVTIPESNEQQQIVEHLNEQTKIIDSTIKKAEQKIELLKEYRQALISEVVTGKIRVT